MKRSALFILVLALLGAAEAALRRLVKAKQARLQKNADGFYFVGGGGK